MSASISRLVFSAIANSSSHRLANHKGVWAALGRSHNWIMQGRREEQRLYFEAFAVKRRSFVCKTSSYQWWSDKDEDILRQKNVTPTKPRPILLACLSFVHGPMTAHWQITAQKKKFLPNNLRPKHKLYVGTRIIRTGKDGGASKRGQSSRRILWWCHNFTRNARMWNSLRAQPANCNPPGGVQRTWTGKTVLDMKTKSWWLKENINCLVQHSAESSTI